jgi:hypothetical protein
MRLVISLRGTHTVLLIKTQAPAIALITSAGGTIVICLKVVRFRLEVCL